MIIVEEFAKKVPVFDRVIATNKEEE